MNEKIKDGVIPIGLCKQAVMKLDSFLTDINEILEDPDIEDDDRDTFNTIKETGNLMIAHIVNIVSKEMSEEEFETTDVQLDEIDSYPEDNDDILDMNIQ